MRLRRLFLFIACLFSDTYWTQLEKCHSAEGHPHDPSGSLRQIASLETHDSSLSTLVRRTQHGCERPPCAGRAAMAWRIKQDQQGQVAALAQLNLPRPERQIIIAKHVQGTINRIHERIVAHCAEQKRALLSDPFFHAVSQHVPQVRANVLEYWCGERLHQLEPKPPADEHLRLPKPTAPVEKLRLTQSLSQHGLDPNLAYQYFEARMVESYLQRFHKSPPTTPPMRPWRARSTAGASSTATVGSRRSRQSNPSLDSQQQKRLITLRREERDNRISKKRKLPEMARRKN